MTNGSLFYSKRGQSEVKMLKNTTVCFNVGVLCRSDKELPAVIKRYQSKGCKNGYVRDAV